MTSVQVNSHVYSCTHVATNVLRGIKQLVRGAGLSLGYMSEHWEVLESGVATWLRSGHLQRLVLEVFDSGKSPGAQLVGRFDFDIDYGYYPGADGDLWMDPDAVAFALRKAGITAAQCSYRVVATTSPGRPDVPGWSNTSLRSTDGFTRHASGTIVGGGQLGAGLSYYTKAV